MREEGVTGRERDRWMDIEEWGEERNQMSCLAKTIVPSLDMGNRSNTDAVVVGAVMSKLCCTEPAVESET